MADGSGTGGGGGKRTVLPWGMTTDALKPNSVQAITQSKLKAFSLGRTNPVKKANPLSKKKEIEEKKQEESKEVAKAFEEFDEFFRQSSKSAKAFVRGNTINPNASVDPSASKSASTKPSGTLYKPTSKFLKEEKKEETSSLSPPVPSLTKKPPKKKGTEKKKSILELFREELKRSQEIRKERHEQRAAATKADLPLETPEAPPDLEPQDTDPFKVDEYRELQKGSFDTGDPLTTNLYVGNINPKMNEEMLCQMFGKFGPLASVKVMWPRTEEERARNKNCGFVAFMKRKDADKALETMKGTTIMGYDVQIGWGKSVPLPPNPIYTPPDMEEEKTSKVPDPPSGLPFNAQARKKSGSKYGNMPPPGASKEEEEDFEKMLLLSLVKVVIPTDLELLRLIHRMIEFVIREGPMFEAMIMNKEMNNPLFQFLFDNQCPAHIYYRWKLFSILNGDSPETWRTEEFRMFEGGSLWKPPPLKNLLSKVLPPIQEVVKKGQLSAKHRDYLEDGLRSVTMERDSIRNLMMWCMDHSESADEIVECVCESLCIDETPLPMKLARLYLLNDILHNCTSYVYNSSAFRRGFEGKLVMIMEHFHTILRTISSRIRAEQFKRRVLACMRAWDTMSVYHFNLVDKLRETFIGKTQEEMEKQRAFQTVAMLMKPEERGASDLTTHGSEMVEEEEEERDIDGVPLLESQPIDFSRTGGGVSIPVVGTVEGRGADFDGEPMEEEDLDGVPLADDDIDGVPLEKEDIDGEPLGGDAPGNQGGVRSKWELVDYGDDSSEEEEKAVSRGRGRGGGGEEAAMREKERQQLLAEIDEKKRKMLREVEVKVMELSDALESAGSYSKAEISERLQKYRDKLMQESVEPSRSPRHKSLRKSRSPSPSTLAKYDLHTSPKSSPRAESHSPEAKKSPPSPSPSPPPPLKSHSPSHKHKRSRSRSPIRKRSKSKSPTRRRSKSKSPVPQRAKSKSPSRRKRSRSRSPRKRSRSPKHHRSKSPHSHRHRSRSPSSSHHRSKKSKRRSRSRSPHKSSKSSSKRSRH